MVAGGGYGGWWRVRRVMISYSTRQQRLADRLHQGLSECGCSPKLDHLDLRDGDRWRETIAWWLSACQTAVVLLSDDAIRSPWVRYELGVLTNRELTRRDVRVVIVYVGATRAAAEQEFELAPFRLADAQSQHEIPDGDPDEEMVADLVKRIHEVAEVGDAPIEQLVSLVADEVREVAVPRVRAARHDLHPRKDPWLIDAEDSRLSFARAYCATPLDQTYGALQTLVMDRRLHEPGWHELIDLNVMTTFDPKALDDLHGAAVGDDPRAVVSAITRPDLAEVAVRAVELLRATRRAYAFLVNSPITGLDDVEVADGIADELRFAIEERHGDAEDFLDFASRREHPVFAILTNAVGLRPQVVQLLEASFPSIALVVLSSAAMPMPDWADHLELDGVGPDLPDDAPWHRYVAHEQAVAAERILLRRDLRRVAEGAR